VSGIGRHCRSAADAPRYLSLFTSHSFEALNACSGEAFHRFECRSALKAEFKLGFSFGIRFVESDSETEEPDIQGFTAKPLAQESLEILDR
jgi:hypothetical protein